jgi:phosphotriesterase-related protein
MSEQTGKVQTVNGPIEPTELGVTLMHEHVFCDLSARFREPAEITKRAFAHRPFETRDRWRVTADPLSNLDNLIVDNMEDAVSELLDFKKAGGRTLVDQTTRGLGRDPEAIRAVSNLTGLNIVIGTGHYVEMTHPADMPTRSEESLAEEMTREILEGVGDSESDAASSVNLDANGYQTLSSKWCERARVLSVRLELP